MRIDNTGEEDSIFNNDTKSLAGFKRYMPTTAIFSRIPYSLLLTRIGLLTNNSVMQLSRLRNYRMLESLKNTEKR